MHDTVSGDVDPVLNSSIVIDIAADEVSKKLDVDDSAAEPPPQKKLRTETDSNLSKEVWLKLEKHVLTWHDKDVLCNGMELNDHHINYCQSLLKRQFPSMGGLMLTELKKNKIACGLQIILCQQTTGL